MHSKNDMNAITSQAIWEYLVLVPVPETVTSLIQQQKEYMARAYNIKHVLPAKPYISIVKFSQYKALEKEVVKRLHLSATGLAPGLINLKGFGSFPTHTIFINITSKEFITSIVRRVRTYSQLSMRLNIDHKPHFFTDPHIAFARELKPWQYEKAWLHYERQSFSARFIATNFHMLGRPVKTSTYFLLNTFHMSPVQELLSNKLF